MVPTEDSDDDVAERNLSAGNEDDSQAPGNVTGTISIVLLAAGSSSRLGQSKQLLQVNGVPLLLHSAQVALTCGAKDVIVILGANEQPHQDLIRALPVSVIANHYWKSGIGSSIKSGLNYLIRKSPDTEAVILMVCDQPSLTAEHLCNLIMHYRSTKAPIVASSYADTLGVPALFARSFFTNLLMLRDEEGAKKIIEQFDGQVKTVDFPEGLFDIDTKEDYQNYISRK